MTDTQHEFEREEEARHGSSAGSPSSDLSSSGSGEELAEAVSAARLATLGRLMAGIAHEINTPLGALSSNHDVVKRSLARLHAILEDEVVDESELAEVRRIVKALRGAMRVNDLAMTRVQELVASLRTFGRPDRAETDRVDLHEGIESVLTLLGHRTGEQIRVERDYGELPLVKCRPQQLNQVFMNLILNAVQALEQAAEAGQMDGPGCVTVRTRREDDDAVVQVQDNGPGIPARIRDRIFEPGFTTKGKRMGMGLGLLIARRVVDRHGGRLDLEPDGRGSTFTMRLPLSGDRKAEEGGNVPARAQHEEE